MQFCRRPLTGLAHGASGYATALLELAAYTQEIEFWYGACQAYAYERSQFLKHVINWPDFRCNELWRAMYEVGEVGVQRMLVEGRAVSLTTTSHMSAWCHGAPGIGLARIRAYQLDGDNRLLQEACAAAHATNASLRDESGNYSLCHGHTGNAEAVLRMTSGAPNFIQGAPALLRLAQMGDLVLAGESPTHGTIGPLPDPTLMLGTAGFLYALARLVEPALPSVLLVEPSSPALQSTRDSTTRFEKLQVKAFEDCNANTAVLIPCNEHLTGRESLFADRHASPNDIRQQLRNTLVCGSGVAAELATGLRQDEIVADLLGNKLDDVEDTLDRLAASATSSRNTEHVRWRLSSRVTLSLSTAQGERKRTLFRRDGFKVREIDLTEFSHSVLQELQTPTTLNRVVSKLIEQRATERRGTDITRLTDAVRQQVSSAIAAGIVVPAWASVSESATSDLKP
jgi:hypothetical protein